MCKATDLSQCLDVCRRWDMTADELICSAVFNFLIYIFFCCNAAVRLWHRNCVAVLKLRGWLGIKFLHVSISFSFCEILSDLKICLLEVLLNVASVLFSSVTAQWLDMNRSNLPRCSPISRIWFSG